MFILALFDGIIEELVEVLVEVYLTPDGHLPHHIALAQESVGHSAFANHDAFLVKVVGIVALFGINKFEKNVKDFQNQIKDQLNGNAPAAE